MTRKKVREHLFRMLFAIDFHQREELSQQADAYLEKLCNDSELIKKESPEKLEEISSELSERFHAVVGCLEDIDEKIGQKASGWSVDRLAKADITILRLAVYEILYDDDVPAKVAANEAVELAKRFGIDKSPSFVNGILGSIVREYSEE